MDQSGLHYKVVPRHDSSWSDLTNWGPSGPNRTSNIISTGPNWSKQTMTNNLTIPNHSKKNIKSWTIAIFTSFASIYSLWLILLKKDCIILFWSKQCTWYLQAILCTMYHAPPKPTLPVRSKESVERSHIPDVETREQRGGRPFWQSCQKCSRPRNWPIVSF